MIRTLVVDDEKLARDRLAGYLRKLDDVDVVGEAKNGIEALERITELKPDLVFLDVQMPGLDGFGVLKSLSEPPQIVPITSSATAIVARGVLAASARMRLTAATPASIVARVPPACWITKVSTGRPDASIWRFSDSRLKPSQPRDTSTAPPTFGCVHSASIMR